MTTDLHEALHDAAARPSSDVDIAALMSGARRRNRGFAVVLLVALVVVASGVVFATRDRGGASSLAVRTESTGTDTPEGWTRIPGSGISIAIPPEWKEVTVLDNVGSPSLVVGTGDATFDPRLICAGTESGGQPVKGTWVALYELPSNADVGAGTTPRPHDFTDPTIGDVNAGCPGSTTDAAAPETVKFFFVDGTRIFQAVIATTELPNRTNEQLGRQILNTLRVDPSGDTAPATTTLAPEPTTMLPATTTLPVETPPASDDEAAIRNAFEQWIYVSPREAIEPYVEDAASIMDSWKAGIAQQPSPGPYDHYKIRVDSVTIVDDTHANVVYSLLFDGRPQYDHVTAAAIKVDGAWKVTRDTVCAILSHGGITCRPRA